LPCSAVRQAARSWVSNRNTNLILHFLNISETLIDELFCCQCSKLKRFNRLGGLGRWASSPVLVFRI
jgi:hypothetical protein